MKRANTSAQSAVVALLFGGSQTGAGVDALLDFFDLRIRGVFNSQVAGARVPEWSSAADQARRSEGRTSRVDGRLLGRSGGGVPSLCSGSLPRRTCWRW